MNGKEIDIELDQPYAVLSVNILECINQTCYTDHALIEGTDFDIDFRSYVSMFR